MVQMRLYLGIHTFRHLIDVLSDVMIVFGSSLIQPVRMVINFLAEGGNHC